AGARMARQCAPFGERGAGRRDRRVRILRRSLCNLCKRLVARGVARLERACALPPGTVDVVAEATTMCVQPRLGRCRAFRCGSVLERTEDLGNAFGLPHAMGCRQAAE